jgi:cobalt-precorrin 5A hydrolase/precorrin-3B C17-methyltransferase
MLRNKHRDPGVVCVDEAGRYAIALVGGHEGGANRLAEQVAAVLGSTAVISTASEATGTMALSSLGADLGFKLANPDRLATAVGELLDGTGVEVCGQATWPLPALPPSRNGRSLRVVISDDLDATGEVIYRPPSLVVGVGASRAVSKQELADLIDGALATARLAPESVRAMATIDLKSDEAGIVKLSHERGWPLVTFSPQQLAQEVVPTPSETVRAVVGTPSVAEAAALRAARDSGRDSSIVVPKRTSIAATAAVARLTPRGRLMIVGLGPGSEDHRTHRATAMLRRASVVVGLRQYVDQIREYLAPGARVEASELGAEEQRARLAVELARSGLAVAVIGSGDAGVYAMASPVLEIADATIDIEAAPGVTAALAASALLGAPLGHDHAYLSLSDLHTPWTVIRARVEACAAADLVVCLYNPSSKRRTQPFADTLQILSRYRPVDTPIGVVRDASRPGQHVRITTLGEFMRQPFMVDMNSVVIVGSTNTVTVAGRMVTTRGYTWLRAASNRFAEPGEKR